MGIRRRLADLVETAIGAKLFRTENIGAALEEVCLKRFLSYFQVDCVFDVGANDGQYAALLRRIGFTGTIISFEPIPEMVQILRQKAKRDPSWHIEPVALSDTAGEAVFNVMIQSEFSSFLSPKHDEYNAFTAKNNVARSITVATSTLKIEYLKYRAKLGFSRPFLKMDTQGNDLVVVQSADETINEFIGLQSELAVKRLYEDARYFHEAILFYQSKGFELSAFVNNAPTAWYFPHLVEIDCIMFRTTALSELKSGPAPLRSR